MTADVTITLSQDDLARAQLAVAREARLLATITRLRAEADQRTALVQRQVEHIAMLETQLAANGLRAQARLRRSPWWTWRVLRGLLAGLPF